jgi:alpha-tubulin suppressor-like RCC1 family protein
VSPQPPALTIDGDQRHMSPSEVQEIAQSLRAENVIEIACGSTHVLLRTQAGSLYSWGKSMEYQLGHGDRKERTQPTLITTVADTHQWMHAACGCAFLCNTQTYKIF